LSSSFGAFVSLIDRVIGFGFICVPFVGTLFCLSFVEFQLPASEFGLICVLGVFLKIN
jgi:hypothetical protein